MITDRAQLREGRGRGEGGEGTGDRWGWLAGSDMGHGAAERWANTSGPLRPVNRGKSERTVVTGRCVQCACTFGTRIDYQVRRIPIDDDQMHFLTHTITLGVVGVLKNRSIVA